MEAVAEGAEDENRVDWVRMEWQLIAVAGCGVSWSSSQTPKLAAMRPLGGR